MRSDWTGLAIAVGTVTLAAWAISKAGGIDGVKNDLLNGGPSSTSTSGGVPVTQQACLGTDGLVYLQHDDGLWYGTPMTGSGVTSKLVAVTSTPPCKWSQ